MFRARMDVVRSSWRNILLRIGVAIFFIRFAAVTSSIPIMTPKQLARGYGDDLNWTTFWGGLQEAKTKNQPILMLIHQERCPACKDFAPRFADDKDIKFWAQFFTMINCKDAEEPMDKRYAPDGRYYPRIIFMAPNGTVLPVSNAVGSRGYACYYFTGKSVVQSMIKVAQLFYDIVYDDAEDL